MAQAYRLQFDPELLCAFLTTADAGTISGASAALHLSQPALSAQIRKLESGVGAQLFQRSRAGVSLTAPGKLLYKRAKQIHALLTDAVQDVAPLSDRPEQLTLAASTTIAAHVIPRLIALFHRHHPAVSLVLKVGNTRDVLRAVTTDAVPLGLVEGHGRAPAVRLEPFLEDEIVLVGPPKVASTIRCLDDLRHQTILWREPGSGTRAVVERALRKAGFSMQAPQYRFQIASTEALKACVIAGLGVTFVSRWAIQSECTSGALVVLRLADVDIRRNYHWALPAGALVHSANEFYRFANQMRPTFGRVPIRDR